METSTDCIAVSGMNLRGGAKVNPVLAYSPASQHGVNVCHCSGGTDVYLVPLCILHILMDIRLHLLKYVIEDIIQNILFYPRSISRRHIPDDILLRYPPVIQLYPGKISQ
jgi:hypothetical protein